jgi:hypothetical protein
MALVHRPQGPAGGDKLIVESSGEIEIKSGGILDIQAGATISYPGTTAYSAGAKMPFWLELPQLPHSTDLATAASVTMVAPQKLEIIDVVAQKTGAGSSGTTALSVLLATSTNGAITDAINMKGVLGALGRAAKVVPALAARASGSVIKATRAGSSGTSVAGLNVEITVRALCLPRATT